MGKIISDIGSDIGHVVDSVSKLVTDVGAAVEQLDAITAKFVAPVDSASFFPAPDAGPSFVVTRSDAEDINGALKEAMKAARKSALTAFKKQWPSVEPAGSDDGVVADYVAGGNAECAHKQMNQDFKNWEIDADPAATREMTSTLVSQISAQLGAAGNTQGHHSLNMNQQINWTLAYGLFTMGNDKQGLVYAYAAAMDSGFGS